MSATRRFAPTLALATALAGCTAAEPTGPAALAARPLTERAEPTLIRGSEPVSFEIAAGECGLTTTVTGEGELRFVVQSTQRPDGTFNPSPINTTSHGTAVGADGSRYVFSYMNNSILRDETGGLSLPFTFTVVDKFVLVGAGGAPDIRVFTRYTVRINEDETFTVLDSYVRGDPECDRI